MDNSGHGVDFRNGEIAQRKRDIEYFGKTSKQGDDWFIAFYALAICVSLVMNGRLTDENRCEIEHVTACPNSPIHTTYVAESFTRILSDKPDFMRVKNDYLSLVDRKDLLLMDKTLRAFIETEENRNARGKGIIFYNRYWREYLFRRGIDGVKYMSLS